MANGKYFLLFSLPILQISVFSFLAYKTFLRRASPYFAALLGPNFAEENNEEIVLNSFDGPTFRKILYYIHSNFLDIKRSNATNLLIGAASLNMSDVESRCGVFLQKNLNIYNIVETWKLLLTFNLSITDKTKQFYARHFSKIPKSTFMELSKDDFSMFIKVNYIHVSEEVIFDYIKEYIELHSSEADGLEEMMDCLDLKCLSEKVSRH